MVMDGIEAHLAVIRPKPLHKLPKNDFQPKYFDLLMLDTVLTGSSNRGMMQLPKTIIPYEDHHLEKASEYLYLFTGADRGGIKALRAIFVPTNSSEPESNKRDMPKAALFCLIVSSADKLNQTFVDHLPTLPGFYDLNHMFETNLISPSSSFTKQARVMLTRLQLWLEEHKRKPDFIEALLRKSAQERLIISVDNPCYISRNKPIVKSFQGDRSVQETFADRCTANESFTKMMAIEKCDKVVINPLFGSGLQYKHRVDAYSINSYWGCGKPDLKKIRLAPAVIASRSNAFINFPVHKLAYEGDASQIANHLRMGSSANRRDNYSWFPLHYAAWFGRPEACKVLIRSGQCNINAVTHVDNWTPLHHAALNGQTYVVEMLLSLDGIDVNVLDAKKQTALNLCENSSQPKFVRCKELLREAMDRPYQKIEVYTMDEEKPCRPLNLVSNDNTTVTQLHQQMLKELGVPKAYEHFFTFWICSPSLQLQLKREHLPVIQLREWESQVKLLTDCENPSKEVAKLYWRRDVRLGVNHELTTLRNANAIRLLFKEAYYNYIHAFYPCDETDALRLAAILMQMRLGEFEPNKAKRYLENDLNLQSVVPFTQLRYKQSWVQKIFNQYKKISNDLKTVPDGRAVPQMQYNFLVVCWNLTVYGSAFFDAQQINKNNKSVPMIIGINDIGLHAIGRDSKQMQHSFKFEQIEWSNKKEDSLLEMKIKSTNRIIVFKTKQAPLISQLMKRLSDINIARTK